MQAQAEDARAVIVVESMFGSTRAVADIVADGLTTSFSRVDVYDVDEAPSSMDGVSLLVVGAPTHAFGMSRPTTREAARQQGATTPAGPGVREWLHVLERPVDPVPAAAFDTRVRKPFLPGSAARAVRRRLRRRGFAVSSAVSFAVGGTPGPLLDGELDRARRWAATLEAPMRRKVGRP